MLLQQLIRTDSEKVFIVVNNNVGATLSGNNLACFDYSATNVSFGNAVATPATSNLAMFAGVVDADIAKAGFGLVQVYGARQSIAVNVGGASISAAGLILGPLNGNFSGQSNGRSFAMGPIALFDNDLSGAVYARGFIRAL